MLTAIKKIIIGILIIFGLLFVYKKYLDPVINSFVKEKEGGIDFLSY